MSQRCFLIFLIAVTVFIFLTLPSQKGFSIDSHLPQDTLESDDPRPPIPEKYRDSINHLPKNEKSLAEGEWLYDTRCSACHGGNLDGNGPEAEGLFPKPANFIYLLTTIKTKESYLFWRIKEGGPGLPKEWMPWNSAMPVWKEELTDEEIWKIILYLYEAVGESPQ
ncbi:MAG: cytochrome c [Nitrospinae bacterium]|nr:cytochrome c [Nitrospinota bacterium]